MENSLCAFCAAAEPEDPDKYIDPNLIMAVELISLPSKKM